MSAGRWHSVPGLIGVGGVPPRDNALAHAWQRRLHWMMIVIALATMPALLIDEYAVDSTLRMVGRTLDLLVFVAFAGELLWMLRVVTHKSAYLARNWLDLLIIAAAAVSLAGFDTGWIALARLARLAMVGLMLARLLGSLRALFSPDALPRVFVLATASLLLGGAGFYWLEPTIHSYAEGLWLAFVTGATVGYGDFIPTTSGARLWAVVMVLLGFAVLSVLTASLVKVFLGEDEAKLRHEMHQDIRLLRDEVRALREEFEAGRRQTGADGKNPAGTDGGS